MEYIIYILLVVAAILVTFILLAWTYTDIVECIYRGHYVTENSTIIEIPNKNNELYDVQEKIIVEHKRIKAYETNDTMYFEDGKKGKIVIEKITYEAPYKWFSSKRVVDSMTSEVKYYIKEVHQVSVTEIKE